MRMSGDSAAGRVDPRIEAQGLLSTARTLLLEHQWGRGAMRKVRNGELCFCVAGAVREAYQDPTVTVEAGLGGLDVDVLMRRVYDEAMGALARTAPGPAPGKVLGMGDGRSASTAFRVVTHANDVTLGSREEAVRWLDAAVEELGR